MTGVDKSHDSPGAFQAMRISDHVYWVGAVDWALRDFHGYATNRGTTYNAYLVVGEKIALIDTVKAPFRAEMLARIASVIDPTRIDYIISNHAEMDHSGCLPEVIAAVRPEAVFASSFGVKALADHFSLGCAVTEVKDGEQLSLGNLTLSFVETRMLHWPDSMFTYLADDGILFSSDAFGMHLATSERYAEEIDEAVLAFEAGRYFANILLPFSGLVTKLLARVEGMGLRLTAIAPDHGPIWRAKMGQVLNWYARWAERSPTASAIVVYDTMWQSTAAMARAIAEGVAAGGVPVQVMPLQAAHRSDVAHALLDAGALIVGSPTLNNGLFPTVADLLTYVKGLRPRNLIGAAFGSYGWSGEAVAQIRDLLTEMKVELIGDDLKAKYVPGAEALAACAARGRFIAETLKEKTTS